MDALLAFLAALLIGTLFEYVVHRLMHDGKVLGRKHAEHHVEGTAQGFVGEFLDYLMGALTIGWAGFLISPGAGWGLASGSVFYAALAAYSHQVQHDNPELCFWMPRPVHHLHHKHKMWHHNFGITFDIWDRVFGTYKKVEWKPEPRLPPRGPVGFLRIKWY